MKKLNSESWEERFKDRFEDFEAAPDDKLWSSIEENIKPKVFYYKPIAAGLLLFLLGGGIGYKLGDGTRDRLSLKEDRKEIVVSEKEILPVEEKKRTESSTAKDATVVLLEKKEVVQGNEEVEEKKNALAPKKNQAILLTSENQNAGKKHNAYEIELYTNDKSVNPSSLQVEEKSEEKKVESMEQASVTVQQFPSFPDNRKEDTENTALLADRQKVQEEESKEDAVKSETNRDEGVVQFVPQPSQQKADDRSMVAPSSKGELIVRLPSLHVPVGEGNEAGEKANYHSLKTSDRLGLQAESIRPDFSVADVKEFPAISFVVLQHEVKAAELKEEEKVIVVKKDKVNSNVEVWATLMPMLIYQHVLPNMEDEVQMVEVTQNSPLSTDRLGAQASIGVSYFFTKHLAVRGGAFYRLAQNKWSYTYYEGNPDSVRLKVEDEGTISMEPVFSLKQQEIKELNRYGGALVGIQYFAGGIFNKNISLDLQAAKAANADKLQYYMFFDVSLEKKVGQSLTISAGPAFMWSLNNSRVQQYDNFELKPYSLGFKLGAAYRFKRIN